MSDKSKTLTLAIDQIERQYGKGSIMKMSSQSNVQYAGISTGSLSLDACIGNGLPKGRIIEIYGPESSGKTTLALHVVAEAQKAQGGAAFIDAEHALDPTYSEKIGVSVKDLLIAQYDVTPVVKGLIKPLTINSCLILFVTGLYYTLFV